MTRIRIKHIRNYLYNIIIYYYLLLRYLIILGIISHQRIDEIYDSIRTENGDIKQHCFIKFIYQSVIFSM